MWPKTPASSYASAAAACCGLLRFFRQPFGTDHCRFLRVVIS
jgi:hypothetical protein